MAGTTILSNQRDELTLTLGCRLRCNGGRCMTPDLYGSRNRRGGLSMYESRNLREDRDRSEKHGCVDKTKRKSQGW